MKHLNATIYIIALILAIFSIFFRVEQGVNVDSSVLSLIGGDKSRQFIRDLTDNAADELSRKAFFLILDEDEYNAVNSAKKVIETAKNSGIFTEIFSGTTPETEREYFNWFFAQRYTLLSDNMRDVVGAGFARPNICTSDVKNVATIQGRANPAPTGTSTQRFIQNFNQRIFAPMPDFYGENLVRDPLMLFMDKMLELRGNSLWISDGGLLIYPSDTTAVLITAILKENSFSPRAQNELEALISQIKQEISSEIAVVSIARFVKVGFDEGKRDAGIIGVISLTVIAVMFLAIFRNIFVIFTGLIPIFCGLIFAFAALFLFSSELNVIALSMGACFVGIVIDYSLHYLVQNEDNPQKRLKNVFGGITLGVISTIAGFCAFFITPIAGLRHIAIMSVFGLLGAYLSVVILFPKIKYANKKLPIKLPQNSIPQVPFWAVILIAVLVAAVSIPGLLKVRFNDGVENFTNPAPLLEAEEALLRRFTQGSQANRFLVVVGKNDNEMLNELSRVSIQLNSLKNEGVIGGFRSIGQYVISEEVAEQNRKNLLELITKNDGEVLAHLRNLGFQENVLQNLVNELSTENFVHFDINQFFASSVSRDFSSTFIRNDTLSAALILLENIRNEERLKSLENRETVFYFNRIGEISAILQEYRETMLKTIIIAAAVIFMFLLIYFSVKTNFLSAITVIIPPFLTLILTQAILGYFGVEQNLMHAVGQLLVLGIGVDYVIFRAKSKKAPNETELALLLSCITSFMAFGLLFFVNTPALRSMGEVVALGLVLSYLSSFLVRKR
ncbi:MAG: MMPL family transporter [Chitinivibrionia bacterium]|nr:MMPL family transporter [Chitinivibrionia bacterium]